jgi:putative tricarboxylic transport membrane protein
MFLGGFMAWQSEKLSLGSPRAPGPGFFSFCCGVLLIGVALMILVQGLKRKYGARQIELRWGRVSLFLGAIFGYAFILEPLGYLLSTFMLLFFFLNMMVKKRWWFALAVAGFISLISDIMFGVFLRVFLPKGLMGF